MAAFFGETEAQDDVLELRSDLHFAIGTGNIRECLAIVERGGADVVTLACLSQVLPRPAFDGFVLVALSKLRDREPLAATRTPLAAQLASGRTSLIATIAGVGSAALVRQVIEWEPDCVYLRDRLGRNPFYLAAVRGNVGTMAELLRANPAATEPWRCCGDAGVSVVHIVCGLRGADGVGCLQVLLDAIAASAVDHPSGALAPPSHVRVAGAATVPASRGSVLLRLLEHVTRRDKQTCLHIIASRGDEAVLRRLVSLDSDDGDVDRGVVSAVVNSLDAHSRTPLWYAVDRGDVDLVCRLRVLGATVDGSVVDAAKGNDDLLDALHGSLIADVDKVV